MMPYRRHLLLTSLAVGELVFCGSAHAQASSSAATNPGSTALGEIVVTARRREENLQSVPVAVTALTSAKLRQDRISMPEDIQYLTPGLTVQGGNFTREGNNYSIRGQAPGGTIVYRDEVPTLSSASSGGAITVPYFDLDSIEILKGPQGTLFGGSTTGGAILVSTAKPSDEFGGYLQATYGNLNTEYLEGALNIPIIPDKVLLRVAADIRRRDGYTLDTFNGEKVDNQNTDAVRLSLTVNPTAHVSDTLVYEFNYRDERIGNAVPFLCNPDGGLAATPGYLAACTAGIALGPRKVDESPVGVGLIEEHFVSNVTTVDLTKDILVKNVFGYIHDAVGNRQDSDGTSLFQSVTYNPFPSLFLNETQQFSDELQIQGKSFDRKFNWILGGFYESTSNPEFAHLFAAVGEPFLVDVDQKERSDEAAVFAQGTYDFSQFIHGLSLTGGLRETQDRSTNISGTNFCAFAPIGTAVAQCGLVPGSYSAAGINAGVSPLSTSTGALTYNVTLDYKPIDAVLLYVARRHGYRPGGIQAFGGDSAEFKTYLPETVDDWELGLKSQFSVGGVPARLNLAVFSDTYDNQQRSISVGPTVSPILNAQKATIQGIEVEGTILPTSWLTIDFNYAYLDAKFNQFTVPIGALEVAQGLIPANSPGSTAILNESASPFALTPKNAFDVTGTVVVPTPGMSGSLTLSANYSYRTRTYFASDTFFQQQIQQAPYGLVNLQAKLSDVGGKPIDIILFVKNLTNQVYLDGDGNDTYTPNPLPGTGVDTVFYGEPRTYGLTVRYHFGGQR
jgi:iron complex outermembrane receptor protein